MDAWRIETSAWRSNRYPTPRTVRGIGYRFDRHADVSIRQASTPSPDLYLSLIHI